MATHYSLISNFLFHLKLSLLSWLKPELSLSLLSWPIHLIAEDPWPYLMVEDPKTHGRNPCLSSHSLSLSSLISHLKPGLSLFSHGQSILWLNPMAETQRPMVEGPKTHGQNLIISLFGKDRLEEIRSEINEDWLVFWYFWFCVLI